MFSKRKLFMIKNSTIFHARRINVKGTDARAVMRSKCPLINIFFCLLVCISIMLFASSPSLAQDDEIRDLSQMIAEKVAPELGKKRIAVVDFLDSKGNLTELGKFIGEEVYMTLVNQSKRYKYRVLDRKHVNRLLEEHKIALSGLADPETAAQFGRFTLANVIIT